LREEFGIEGGDEVRIESEGEEITIRTTSPAADDAEDLSGRTTAQPKRHREPIRRRPVRAPPRPGRRSPPRPRGKRLIAYAQGAIVLIEDPYRDGLGPVLVVSNTERSYRGKQYTVAVITRTERG
jgi:hypothetical protein